MNTKIITIANPTRYVGKTTSTAAIGDILARKMNKRVLVIDTTSPGDLSCKFGCSPNNHANLTLDILLSEALNSQEEQQVDDLDLTPFIYKGIMYQKKENVFTLKKASKYEHLSIICSSPELNFVYNLMDYDDNSIITNLLEHLKNCNEFDYILIDTPPSYTLRNIRDHFIAGSDYLLIPLVPSKNSLAGVERLVNSFVRISKHSKIQKGNSLQLLGLFFCNVSYKDEVDIDSYVMDNIAVDKSSFFRTSIPQSTDIINYDNVDAPITVLFPDSSASSKYVSLVEEMLNRIDNKENTT